MFPRLVLFVKISNLMARRGDFGVCFLGAARCVFMRKKKHFWGPRRALFVKIKIFLLVLFCRVDENIG